MSTVGSRREFDDESNPFAAPESTDVHGDADLEEGTFVYANFGQRLVAVIIDGFIMNFLGLAIGLFAGVFMAALRVDPENPVFVVIIQILGILISWFYEAGMIASSKQATLGKMAMGIRVTDMDGARIGFTRSTGRYFAKILSAFTLLIGYLMQPFTEHRQALHDKLAGTLVLKKV